MNSIDINKGLTSTSVAEIQITELAKGISVENVVGALSLNLTQPECSDLNG